VEILVEVLRAGVPDSNGAKHDEKNEISECSHHVVQLTRAMVDPGLRIDESINIGRI
jgi:hypothetical protein